MLGHKALEVLGLQFETYGTLRVPISRPDVADKERVVLGVHAEDRESIADTVARVRPEVVVNCIGVVKQLAEATAPIPSITTNALFPHLVAEITAATGARMIQISTDCVFSGRRGRYNEDDEPDPIDLYGRTKLLGETNYGHTLTIRTSIIGRELSGAHGLLEWFLSQTGTIRGYSRAIFSGLTTQALAETLALVIADHRELSGTWHVAGEPIAKYDLLKKLSRVYDHDVTIERDDDVEIDRSLDDTRFRVETQIPRPTWAEMLDGLAHDPYPYSDVAALRC